MRSSGRASKTPEHSGRFRRKPLRHGLLRRGVSRNLAAPNPRRGCLFLFFLFFFFLFKRRFILQPQRFLDAFRTKVPLHRTKVPSISDKSTVFFSYTY